MLLSIRAIRKLLKEYDLTWCKVEKNKGGIDIGWLLPNNYIISANRYDHEDIIDALGLDYIEAFEHGLVRKAIETGYECANTKESLDLISNDLIVNLSDLKDSDLIIIEIVNTVTGYRYMGDNKVYQFLVEDYKRQDKNLSKLLNPKYRTY